MAVFDGYGRFLRVWKQMRWEKLAEEEFLQKYFALHGVVCLTHPAASGR
ncbi:MAG: hypothetical protein ACLTSA_09180 [Faecalibacterium sp.]